MNGPQLPRARTAPDGNCTASRRLPADVWHAIRDAAARHDMDPAVVLIAAFARTLADWSKESRFALDVGAVLAVDADPAFAVLDVARALHRDWSDPGFPLRLHAGVLLHAAEEGAEEGAELILRWDGGPASLPDGVLDDVADAHVALLERLASQPGAWTLPAPDQLPARQQQIREQVNATGGPVPGDLLHEMFWRQAAITPDAPAVVTDERMLTYRQLRAAASATADRLRGGGDAPAMVAVVLDKGWEQAAAVLGVLAAGAAYVPIAPDVPTERLHHLLAHSEATFAVTTADLDDALSWPAGVRRVLMTKDDLVGEGQVDPPRRQDQRDLAYVIYTSGSTGSPKGVMIDHRGAVNTIADINRRFAIGPQDRVFALSSLSFDLSVYDIFGPLAVGGAVVMPAPGTAQAPWDWLEAIEEHRVTVWDTVPALVEMLVEYTAGRGLRLPDTLRLVLMSGDWIPVSLPERLRALSRPGIQVIGAGGATEASIWSNFHPIGEVDPDWTSIPYGKPLTNQHFEVLDGALRRRPDWVPGELYIGGYGVAMGYWRDPERTANSFITHPRTGARLYRTGDLGRYLPDGNLEFLGREDFQVKVHGFRVELGEIEAALAGHEAVTGAVVAAVDTAGGGKRLVAYVTPEQIPLKRLRDHLAGKLPAYMVPDQYVALDSFPLTGNGKVDRAALPTRAGNRGDGR